MRVALIVAVASLLAALNVATALPERNPGDPVMVTNHTHHAPDVPIVRPSPGPKQRRPCPPASFKTVDNFSVKAYIAAPWYIQKQVMNHFIGQ